MVNTHLSQIFPGLITALVVVADTIDEREQRRFLLLPAIAKRMGEKERKDTRKNER